MCTPDPNTARGASTLKNNTDQTERQQRCECRNGLRLIVKLLQGCGVQRRNVQDNKQWLFIQYKNITALVNKTQKDHKILANKMNDNDKTKPTTWGITGWGGEERQN